MNWRKIEGMASVLTALIGLFLLIHIYHTTAIGIQMLGLKFEEISFMKIFWINSWFLLISISLIVGGLMYFKNEKSSWILKLSILSALLIVSLMHYFLHPINHHNFPGFKSLASYMPIIPILTFIVLVCLLSQYFIKKYAPTKKELLKISSLSVGLILLKMVFK